MRLLCVLAFTLIAVAAACSGGDDDSRGCIVVLPGCDSAGEPASHTRGTLSFEGQPQFRTAMGEGAARVSIDLWVNFLCCRDWMYEVLPRLVDEYVKPGKVQIKIRHSAYGGDEVTNAHLAAACASDQSQFYKAFDSLYFNYSNDRASYSKDRIAEKFDGMELNFELLNTCIANEDHRSDIEGETIKLLAYSNPPLPAFVMNRRLVERSATWEDVKAAVDAEIRRQYPEG